MGRKRIELTGRRFGRLLVKEELENNKCICKCDCGEYKEIKRVFLLNGNTKSCGCLRREINTNNAKNVIQKKLNTLRKEGTYISNLNSATYKNNTSGVRGVTFKPSKNLWYAYIGFQKKLIHLGTFKTKEEAVKARLRAEETYFKPILEKYKKEN